ncbi:hypothetical protein P879_07169 [Paragonimus westermani]|uniref:Uncharacterized protein n=1 Tax=Paragonimus westermani TaxID=34504 RepID=A0A8T0DAS3_9TREM|nr:hypothetical protein P879_07169 [Paragonimus westermani]
MSLQTDVALAFRKNVFERLQKQGSWKILILDKRATQVINTVYRMQDLTDFGITRETINVPFHLPLSSRRVFVLCTKTFQNGGYLYYVSSSKG